MFSFTAEETEACEPHGAWKPSCELSAGVGAAAPSRPFLLFFILFTKLIPSHEFLEFSSFGHEWISDFFFLSNFSITEFGHISLLFSAGLCTSRGSRLCKYFPFSSLKMLRYFQREMLWRDWAPAPACLQSPSDSLEVSSLRHSNCRLLASEHSCSGIPLPL